MRMGRRKKISGGPMPATWERAKIPTVSKAITDVELLSLEEDTLDIVVTWNQLAAPDECAQGSAEPTDWRMMSGMFAVDNLTVGAFASLPPANIQALLAKFNRIAAKRGQTIIKQGDPGDYYYLIESGRCRVSRLIGGSPMQLAQLKEMTKWLTTPTRFDR